MRNFTAQQLRATNSGAGRAHGVGVGGQIETLCMLCPVFDTPAVRDEEGILFYLRYLRLLMITFFAERSKINIMAPCLLSGGDEKETYHERVM